MSWSLSIYMYVYINIYIYIYIYNYIYIAICRVIVQSSIGTPAPANFWAREILFRLGNKHRWIHGHLRGKMSNWPHLNLQKTLAMGHAQVQMVCYLIFWGIKWRDHFPQKEVIMVIIVFPIEIDNCRANLIFRHTQTYHISCFLSMTFPFSLHWITMLSPFYKVVPPSYKLVYNPIN